MTIITTILFNAFLFTFQAALVIIVPVILTTMLGHHINMKAVGYAHMQFKTSFIKVVIWPSVVFHEICHAAMCSLFGHRIEKISFYNTSQQPGFVLHSYNIYNPIHRVGNFFIGIAPIILGAVILFITGKYLVPAGFMQGIDSAMSNHGNMFTLAGLVETIVQIHTATVTFYSGLINGDTNGWSMLLFIYLVFIISSAMRVSPEDARTAFDGIKILSIATIVAHIVLQTLASFGLMVPIIPFQLLLKVVSFIFPIVLFAVVVNLLFCVGLLLSLKTKEKLYKQSNA